MEKLTPARRKALEVLGRVGEATVGGRSVVDHPTDPVIPAALADFLKGEGWAEPRALVEGGTVTLGIVITQAGHAAYMDRIAGRIGPATAPDSPSDALEAVGGPDGEAQPETDVEAVAVPNEFEGRRLTGVVTKVAGTADRIASPVHHGERGVALVEWECTGIAFPSSDGGIRRVQTLTLLDLIELDDGRRMLNELKLANDPSPLPFKTKADGEIFGDPAVDGAAPVLVIFAGGARAAWPDDFPAIERPIPGERLAVPGTDDDDDVSELLDLVDGHRIAGGGQ